MNPILAEALSAVKPLEKEAITFAVTWLKSNKTTVIGDVDKTISGAENQLAAAITKGLQAAGGVVKLFAGSLGVAITQILQNYVTSGEADLSALYDKGVGELESLAAAA